jgi:hypothetical protein
MLEKFLVYGASTMLGDVIASWTLLTGAAQ